MLLGTAKLSITPTMPVRMSGYATRTTTFEDVKEDLFLRVQIHQQAETQLVFLYADILWWGSDFVADCRKAIAEAHQISAESVFFMASHNHSGPPTSNLFIPTLETYSAEYCAFLQKIVLAGIGEALGNLEEVAVQRHNGLAQMNVFRRRLVDGKIQMLPNYDVAADPNLTIISFSRNDGTLKASMVHYPCHANLSNENVIQPDYPGVALRMLDELYPNSVAMFLQGCTGDLRPNSVLGEAFISNNYERVLIFSEAFFKKCKDLLESPGEDIAPELVTKRALLALPLENTLTTAQVEEKLDAERLEDREWAEVVLRKGNKPYEEIEISYINYCKILQFFTFNCEISQYYAQHARTLSPGAVCIAYTNGMIGYVSTAQQIGEGGYEPKDSALYFALAGTYRPEVEHMIREQMETLMK